MKGSPQGLEEWLLSHSNAADPAHRQGAPTRMQPSAAPPPPAAASAHGMQSALQACTLLASVILLLGELIPALEMSLARGTPLAYEAALATEAAQAQEATQAC